MSVYTTEVRYICETEAGLISSSGYNDIDSVIDKSWNKIFSDFPIFDEEYREPLCKKILNHYYTREIGAETAALWKFWLNQKMREIMPYYNKLYESERLKFDPFNDINLTREINEESSGNRNSSASNSSTSESTHTNNETDSTMRNTDSNNTTAASSTNETTGETKNTQTNSGSNTTNTTINGQKLHSDTPQGSINNLAAGDYLTDAELSTDTTNSTLTIDTTNAATGTLKNSSTISGSETTTGKNTEQTQHTSKSDESENRKGSGQETSTTNDNNLRKYIEHTTGKSSSISFSKLIAEYRETFLNIDMDIIFELKDLFLNIY